MKVILLAGGFGTRLSEYTEAIPKPMVPIGGRPLIWHIMSLFSEYGHNEFFIALGYKGKVIKEYFLNYRTLNSDFTVDISSGDIVIHGADDQDWKVTLVDTGLSSMTGGRVKRMREFIGSETCFLTYGDGLANINLDALLAFHHSHGRLITVSAVHPSARFGELKLEANRVISFQEKRQTTTGWINGGFFVIEPGFIDLIRDDSTVLERDPLEQATSLGELMAYKHDGFWQCMDVKRDKDLLEELWQTGNPPWKQ